jgi:hypothetical protein
MNKIAKQLTFIFCFLVTAFTLHKFYNSHKSPINKHANMLALASVHDSSAQDALTQIVESNSIEVVKNFVAPDTLFIFDYDNVLVEGKEDYGFDAWFCAMLAELEKKGASKAVAKAKLLPIYENIQRSSAVQVVEPCTKALIEYLKSEGHNVMILTIRSICLIETVFRQLKSVGIDIERGAISENGVNATLCTMGSKYLNGVLFCDTCSKGPALKAFLSGRPELRVKKIVFVDDKLKNLESVKVAAQELGSKFVGIRYGCTDARASSYKLDKKSLELAASLVNQDSISKLTSVDQQDSVFA